jgi:hypothetical protein
MSEHFIITADRGHLRVFLLEQPPGQATPRLREVQGLDFPAGRSSYTYRDSDMAGRFQSSNHPSRGAGAPQARTGMSIDERLPMQEEEERRETRDLVQIITSFLEQHDQATWDFAAGPAIHQPVVELLPPPVRTRLRQAIAKDLVNQPTEELLSHFEQPHETRRQRRS